MQWPPDLGGERPKCQSMVSLAGSLGNNIPMNRNRQMRKRETLSLLLQGLNLRQQWIFKDEIPGRVMWDWNEGHDIYESQFVKLPEGLLGQSSVG